MSRFTLPRDIYHGKGCLAELKNLKGKKAILVVGGGSMKRQGFLDKAVNYLKEGGMEVTLFEGVEPDPSVETVMKGAQAMRDFEPDWIVAMGGKQNSQPFLPHPERLPKLPPFPLLRITPRALNILWPISTLRLT